MDNLSSRVSHAVGHRVQFSGEILISEYALSWPTCTNKPPGPRVELWTTGGLVAKQATSNATKAGYLNFCHYTKLYKNLMTQKSCKQVKTKDAAKKNDAASVSPSIRSSIIRLMMLPASAAVIPSRLKSASITAIRALHFISSSRSTTSAKHGRFHGSIYTTSSTTHHTSLINNTIQCASENCNPFSLHNC